MSFTLFKLNERKRQEIAKNSPKRVLEGGYFAPFDAQGTVRCGIFFDFCVHWAKRNLLCKKIPQRLRNENTIL